MPRIIRLNDFTNYVLDERDLPEIYTKEELKERIEFSFQVKSLSWARKFLAGATILDSRIDGCRIVAYYGIPALHINFEGKINIIAKTSSRN